MKVSGFTFIRNAVKFDYPVVEAILSILPVCDEVVVAVGKSDDGTRDLITAIDPLKIKIIDTIWDDSLRDGGRVLAAETDKAFDAVSPDSDWAFYVQGDEVVHERYLPAISETMKKWKDDPSVEGILLGCLNFYGSYDYIGDSRKWRRHEIRIVRKDSSIRSYGDAHSFRKKGQLLRVKPADAVVYHYGWVKPPVIQQQKQQNFHKLWHDDNWMKKNIPEVDEFDYSLIDSLALFKGSHPQVMQERVRKQNWKFSFDPLKKNFSVKVRVLQFIEKYTGWRIGEYKNYHLI